MRYDVVTMGSATRDVYIRGNAFRIQKDKRSSTGKSLSVDFGAKYDLDDVLFETGGGATNTAVTFARMGLKTAFLGKIGRDVRGKAVIDVMHDEGVDTSLVTHDARLPTAYSLILSFPNGERTVLVYRGASKSVTDSILSAHKRWNTRWLYATSVGGNIRFIAKAFRFVKRQHGKIAWNPGVSELQHGGRKLALLLAQTDLLFLNTQEAMTLTGQSALDVQSIVASIRKWTKGIVVITNSRKGAWAADAGTLYRSGAHPMPVIDTTGAGDAFGSGFLTGLVKRPGDIPFALQLGTANAEGNIRILGAKTGLLRRLPPRSRLVPVTKTLIR